MKELINEFTNQRIRLDALKSSLGSVQKSRGQALAFTALEKGRMYIGEICRELGKEYPYEATKTATTAEGIQDAVDVADSNTKQMVLVENEIVNLNNLRNVLDTELEKFETNVFGTKGLSVNFKPKTTVEKFKMDCIVSEAWRSLKETCMWLGIRLGEIRDNNK